MTPERTFRFCLQSRHVAPDRSSTDLSVQWLNAEGRWEPQELSFTMPGFRMYLISLLLCQHVYLVANAREQRIPLERVTARFSVVASEDWMLRSVTGDFELHLEAGKQQGVQQESGQQDDGGAASRAACSDHDLAAIAERMQTCPVSRNLPSGVEKRTTLRVINGADEEPAEESFSPQPSGSSLDPKEPIL